MNRQSRTGDTKIRDNVVGKAISQQVNVALDDGESFQLRNIRALGNLELREYVTVARRVMGETANFLKWTERVESLGAPREQKELEDSLHLISLHSANLALLEAEAARRGLKLPDWRNRRRVQRQAAWFSMPLVATQPEVIQ